MRWWNRFQFTPLREGRRFCLHRFEVIILFQFTPLREGRPTASTSASRFTWLFQFTPLREGRPAGEEDHLAIIKFQFTPLREGRPRYSTAGSLVFTDFNSRPCVRGDFLLMDLRNLLTNFNSRPCVRGDRDFMLLLSRPEFYFNSRPCVRGDCRDQFSIRARSSISIHAPA